MIGSNRRVRSNHSSYHFVFTKAACTDLYRNFSSSKMPQTCSSKMPWTCFIVDRPQKRLFGPGEESAVLIIVFHTSSVLVTVRASKKKSKLIQKGTSLWSFFWNSGSFKGSRLFLTELEVEIKNAGPVIILAPHGKSLLSHLLNSS